MISVVLLLTPRERATFSEQAATQGAGRTRLAPTGAALWGYAAEHGYKSQSERAYERFHSGAVRFSDCYPLTRDGSLAWPVPQILCKPKGQQEHNDDNHLASERIWVGRRAFFAEGQGQPELLSEGYINARLERANIARATRLRTATLNGRAKRDALFSIQHIESDDLRYAAQIEADDEGDLRAVVECFQRTGAIRLGRGRNSNGGGWYECRILPNTRLFQPPSIRSDIDLLYIWALSDLVLDIVDGGFPPAPVFGLDGTWRFASDASTLSYRRWAPWNAYLGSRDVERLAIKAGSVLAYERIGEAGAAQLDRLKHTVGAWREQGLGRVWFDPPLLRGTHPEAWNERAIAPALEQGREVEAAAQTELARWAEREARLADVADRDARFDKLRQSIKRLKKGPSSSQWRAVGQAALDARDLSTLSSRLFGEHAVCGLEGQVTRREDWGAEAKLGAHGATVRQWLQHTIESLGDMPYRHARWIVEHLASEAAEQRKEARHG